VTRYPDLAGLGEDIRTRRKRAGFGWARVFGARVLFGVLRQETLCAAVGPRECGPRDHRHERQRLFFELVGQSAEGAERQFAFSNPMERSTTDEDLLKDDQLSTATVRGVAMEFLIGLGDASITNSPYENRTVLYVTVSNSAGREL
jgi:hypothetical protein